MSSDRRTAVLLFSCPDRRGLVARLSQFIYARDGNIIDLDEPVDAEEGIFSIRIAWDLTDSALAPAAIESAFAGSDPYRQAFRRGVKVIGATSHCVTAELDEGPIIEQEITRISHKDYVADLQRKGRDLERLVLARALRYHAESRVIVRGRKTLVFA